MKTGFECSPLEGPLPKLILCDLDGTLADSMPCLYRVYSAFLRHYGMEGHRDEFEELIGPSLREVVAILRERYALSDDEVALYSTYTAILTVEYPAGIELAAGARDFIRRGRLSGARFMVVTSASRRTAHEFLVRQGIADAFEGVVGFEDVSFPKPHPSPYLVALERAALPAAAAIAVEDSASGVASATAAGIDTYWISTQHPSATYTAASQPRLHRIISWHMLQKTIYGTHDNVL